MQHNRLWVQALGGHSQNLSCLYGPSPERPRDIPSRSCPCAAQPADRRMGNAPFVFQATLWSNSEKDAQKLRDVAWHGQRPSDGRSRT